MESKLSNLEYDEILEQVKDVYDELKEREVTPNSKPITVSAALKQLLTTNFHHEQIWQQIELQNSTALKRLRRNMKKHNNESIVQNILKDPAGVSSVVNRENEEEPSMDPEEFFDREMESDANEDNSLNDFPQSPPSSSRKAKPDRSVNQSVVDDRFFKLDEMEAFLEAEERKQGNTTNPDSDDDTNISYSDEEEEEGEEMFYDQFFDPPTGEEPDGKSPQDKKKTVSFAAMDDDSSGGDEEEYGNHDVEPERGAGPTSTLEEREHRLQSLMEQMEEQNLLPKSWQMAGEVTSEKRPENSLLAEHVDFEHTTKPAPVITKEHTERLEGLIKQRIKDKAWDDVERQSRSVADAGKYREALVLDEEKSKVSLSQVYEQEFLKQTQKEEEVKENPLHQEIRTSMQGLFRKLDALTNYHYTPAKVAPEVRLVNNMKSLDMEDVAPVSVSDANLVAPEELLERKTILDLKEDSEKTKEDKKRERKKKKSLQRAKAERKQLKSANALLEETQKKDLAKIGRIQKAEIDIGATSKGKAATSSTAFFDRLQKEVSGEVKAKRQKLDGKVTKKKNFSSKWKL